MTRLLIVGGAGMLGHKLCQRLRTRFDVYATFHRSRPAVAEVFTGTTAIQDVDVRDIDRVRGIIRELRPDAVVNAAGIVKQRAEAHDPIESVLVNALLPHHLAAECTASGAYLVHLSTDCVFSGLRGDYREADVPDPIDLYGRSKLLGEVSDGAVLTIRTSMIGRELASRRGLLEWFLANDHGSVRGFARAIFSGLSTSALADVIAAAIDRRLTGLWHVSSEPISKYALLVLLRDAFSLDIQIDRDEEVESDRSLNSDRFWGATRLVRPSWPAMAAALASDTAGYPAMIGERGR